jgi:ribosomal protein L24
VKTRVHESCSALFILAALLAAPHVRAAEDPVPVPSSVEASADDSDDDSADEADEVLAADEEITQVCHESICVGMTVNVVSGESAGSSGTVVGLDEANATVTLVDRKGEYLYPAFTEIAAIAGDDLDGCTSNVCVGDKVKILDGPYRKKKGRVVGTNDADFTATVYIKRKKVYVVIDVRQLLVKSRPGSVEPGSYRVRVRRYRVCPMDSVFDSYRGCVRTRIYRPMPSRTIIVHHHRVPRRVIIRHGGPGRPGPVVVHRHRRVRVDHSTGPSHPRPDRPSRPHADRPSHPRHERPSHDRPSTPSHDRPSRPSHDRPSRPSTERPSHPTHDRPSRPSADRPSRPSGDRPSRPSGDRPSRPANPRRF